MVFIMGMYWGERSPDVERIRMRGCRGGGGVVVEVGSGGVWEGGG